jgi:small-conductance mechanosensitive channel
VLALNDNGVALELGVWISDPHIQGGLRSSLYRGVLRTFAENGIRIPAPRRDVRIEATATASNDSAREAAGGPQPGDVPPTAMPS